MSRRPGHRCEPLERRLLMAFGPLTGEVLVNGTTAGDQALPAAASDADGDYVIAWGGNGGQTTPATDDDDTYGVYARRYNAAGSPLGGEFRVNTATVGDQFAPAVAMDDSGDFVIAWQSLGQDPGGSAGVYARRYNAAGQPQGGEFRVNTRTADTQVQPAAAMDADGDFVIAWTSVGQDGAGAGVYAKRYSAAGAELARPAQALPGDGVAEFRVNTTTANAQQFPDVAMDDSGDFVVAWQSRGQDVPADSMATGVYAQRFSSAGVPQGVETLVPATTAGSQNAPAVAMDDDGDFVVAYESEVPGNGYDILAQRFNAAGAKQGGELRVNTHLPGNQIFVSAAMDADGDFAIAWSGSGGQDVPAEIFNYGNYAQRYNAAGGKVGGEFRLNTTLAGNQFNPALAMEDNGEFVVAWDSSGQDDPADTVGSGVYSRRYGEVGGGDTVAPRVSAVFVDGVNWTAAFRQFLQSGGVGSSAFGFQVPGGAGQVQLDELPWANANRVHVRFSEDVIVDQGDLAVHGVNTANYPVTNFAYDAVTFTASWTLGASVNNDKVLLDVNADAGGANPGVTDKATPAANRLDGEWTNGTSAFPSGNGMAGGDFRFQMNMLPGDVNRSGGSVNSIDLQLERNRQFTSTSNPGNPPNTYTAFHDVDGNGNINSIDLQLVRNRQFTMLPSGNPSLVAARPSVFASSRPVTARPADALFGSRGPEDE